MNDFDVISPAGSSVMEVSYGPPIAYNGAVISKRTVNSNGQDVGVLMSGFSFIYIRDDESDSLLDRAGRRVLAPRGRADHLHDIFTWLAISPPQPVSSKPTFANALSQNYPNPFNPTTTIAFSIKERGHVSLAIYNVAGERVQTLADEIVAAGAHTSVWDGRDAAGQPVSSGVYFYQLKATGFEQTRKMVLLK
jgi:hypothetical protein